MKKIFVFTFLLTFILNSNAQNVGIGTTTPAAPLHIVSSYINPLIIDGGNNMFVTLAKGGNNFGFLGSYSGNPNDMEIGTYLGNTTGSIILSTNNNPKLTVANNGNVGIGERNPGFPLNFADGPGDKISLWGNSTSGSSIGFGAQLGLLQIHSYQASDDIAFGYGSSNNFTEQMRIKGNGNVGIGTINPNVPLHIKSTNNNPVIIDGGNQLYVTLAENGNNVGYIGSFAGNPNDVEMGTYGGNTTGSVILSTNNIPKLTVNNSGNVGIGTSVPAEKLEVSGKIKTTSLQITNGATSGNILTSDVNGNASWTAPASTTNYWVANGANISKINSGNVGIGTNLPTTAKLVIAGNSGEEGLDLATTDQYANMRVIRNNLNASDKDMYIGYQSGALSALHLFSNNNETVTVKGNNVGIGNVTPKSTMDITGTLATRVQYKTSNSGAISLDNTATIWIFSLNIGASIVLPNPFDCPNRRYTIANRNNVAMTISNYYNLSNSLVGTIPAFSSMEVVSGGSVWEQIK
jgi:hypothetical protein